MRLTPTDPQEIDAEHVARLLQGALSEHEQRLMAVRLLRSDADYRRAVARWLDPFEMFDADLAAAYEDALAADADPGPCRRELLARALERTADPAELLRGFTVADAVSLGPVSRRIFSWTTAEYLLERGQRGDGVRHAKVSLYLALMMIDVVEILGAVGHCPEFPSLVRDVRRRIYRATDLLADR